MGEAGDPREVHPGLFVSSLTPTAWDDDPAAGSLSHVAVREPGAFLGLSRYDKDPDPIRFTAHVRETMVVLEGSVRIEIDGGPTLELRAGDLVSLPAGTAMTWHITAPFRELWFVADPY